MLKIYKLLKFLDGVWDIIVEQQKTTLRNQRNEFIKKLKYEIFKRFKLRENPENKNFQLLMLHTRTEATKNEGLYDEAEEEKGNNDFSDFIM